jgi:hypothetical protein
MAKLPLKARRLNAVLRELLHNFFDPGGDKIPAGTGILASLAVEEHFYIFSRLSCPFL